MKDTKEQRIKIFVCASSGQCENFTNFGRMEERSGQLNESYEHCLVKERFGATNFAADGGNLPDRGDVDDELMLEVSHEVIVNSDDSGEEVEPDQLPHQAVSEEAVGPNGSLFSDDHIQYTYAVASDHTYCKVISNRPMEIVSDEPKEDLSIQPVDSSSKTYGEPYDLDLNDCLFQGIAEIVPCPSLDEIVLDETSLETNLLLDQLIELYLGAE
ncbi:unnamed protein product [Orchesella dallaii]|uniref:Uncharacterized protein n=1 Tax=Orchesella dallaii TaxID=48710 RepID=A0ABP1RNM6_9HEXA